MECSLATGGGGLSALARLGEHNMGIEHSSAPGRVCSLYPRYSCEARAQTVNSRSHERDGLASAPISFLMGHWRRRPSAGDERTVSVTLCGAADKLERSGARRRHRHRGGTTSAHCCGGLLPTHSEGLLRSPAQARSLRARKTFPPGPQAASTFRSPSSGCLGTKTPPATSVQACEAVSE